MTDPAQPVPPDLSAFTDREIAEAAVRELVDLASRLGIPTPSMLAAGAQPTQPGTLMHGVLVLQTKVDQVGRLIETLLDVLGPGTKAQVLSRLSLDDSSRRLEAARMAGARRLSLVRGTNSDDEAS